MPGFQPLGSAPIAALADELPDLFDSLAVQTILYRPLVDALTTSVNGQDTPSSNVWPALADALTATSSFTPEVLANLIERLSASANVQMNAVLQGTAADRVSFLDSVMAAWQLLLTENIATAGDAVGSVTKLAALIDALAATGQATGNMTAFAACTAAMALEGLLAQGFTVQAADQAILADTSAAIAKMLGPLVDALQVSADATPMLRLSCVSADSVAIAHDPAALLRAKSDLSDGLLFYVNLRLGDTDYTGWVLNTDSKAASEYRSFPFDAFATFKGKHYAAGPTGIAKLGGAKDNGANIEAWLRTTLTHFGTSKFKRVPDAYMGVSADGALVLKVVTFDPGTGAKSEDWYAVTRKQELGPGTGQVAIGRGLKSTWWQFELHNVGGSDFEVDSIELRPLVLDRRI